MEVITDLEVKREMRYGVMSNHYEGSEAPSYVVLKFVADSYNLFIDWESTRGNI